MSLSRLLVSLSCVGMVISPAMTNGPLASTQAAPKVFDVSLTQAGQLVGQVVNAAGQAEADLTVILTQERKAVAVTKTDARNFPNRLASVWRLRCQRRGSGIHHSRLATCRSPTSSEDGVVMCRG